MPEGMKVVATAVATAAAAMEVVHRGDVRDLGVMERRGAVRRHLDVVDVGSSHCARTASISGDQPLAFVARMSAPSSSNRRAMSALPLAHTSMSAFVSPTATASASILLSMGTIFARAASRSSTIFAQPFARWHTCGASPAAVAALAR